MEEPIEEDEEEAAEEAETEEKAEEETEEDEGNVHNSFVKVGILKCANEGSLSAVVHGITVETHDMCAFFTIIKEVT